MNEQKIENLKNKVREARKQGQATVKKAREQEYPQLAEICDVGLKLIMQEQDQREAPPPPTTETHNQVWSSYQKVEEDELGRMIRVFVDHLRTIESQAATLSMSVSVPRPPDPAFEEAMKTTERIDNILGPSTEARWFVENAGLNV